MRTLLFAGIVSGSCVATGCGLAGDSDVGARGSVRFSLVHDYVESRDLSAPVAVGRAVLLALERPDGSTFTELELRVEGPGGGELERLPLGFSQYAIALDEAGPHRLLAVDRDSRVVDSLAIRAEEVDDVELDDTARVTTFREEDGAAVCTIVEEMPLPNVVLHQNQTMEMFLVPRARNGEALIGLLALTASGPSSVALRSPLVGEGRTANTLVVDPIEEMADTIRILIEEEDRTIEAPIAATNEQKLVACQS